MSVSAHPTPQPGTEEYHPVFVGKTLEQLGVVLTRYPTKQAALLPALWLVQEARGWISDRNMAEVAEVLGLTPAYVKGVVTFYTMYHQHPVGKHFVQVCTTSPCNVCGAEAVVQALLDATGAGELGATSPDGKWTVIEVECLGACGFATPLLIDDDFIESVTPEKVAEPGTFKDREIMRWTPHALLEGTAIAAHAIQAEVAYVYIRGEFTEPYAIMEQALGEANAAGVFGTIKIHLHRGAGAYICGEETALMNSIEGKRGNPRIKPPFPAAFGVFGMPTTINNGETLAAGPDILRNGAGRHKGVSPSSPESNRTKLVSAGGHVRR